MRTYRASKSGFTLVEILIVVIILGILAAIVIPQFTNASQDARESSVVSQLQTLRSQVELYKLQHHERYPTDPDGLATDDWDWDLLTGKTDDINGHDAGVRPGIVICDSPRSQRQAGVNCRGWDTAIGSIGIDTKCLRTRNLRFGGERNTCYYY